MFNKTIKEEIEKTNRNWETKLTEQEQENELKIIKLVAEHDIALKEKDFELKHFESETTKVLKEKVNQLEKEKAVLQKEKEMLDKITDLNADVIDVKELVKNLINKLPEVKLTSLSVQGNNKE